MVNRLERMWSRFVPESEISQLNRNPGAFTVVSPETFELIARARDATVLTAGRFNPLMLDQICQLGYRQPWNRAPRGGRAVPEPGCTDPITLLNEVNAVMLPAGSAFDPGGIGKGVAADLVTNMLVAEGATSSSVELGGDLRVSGSSWLAENWAVDVEDPFDRDGIVGILNPHSGAVATSSRLQRRWKCDGTAAHHLLDPSTGLPAVTDLVAVTACSSVAWWAEVAAKVALMAGARSAPRLLQQFGTPGIIVTEAGGVFGCPARTVGTKEPTGVLS